MSTQGNSARPCNLIRNALAILITTKSGVPSNLQPVVATRRHLNKRLYREATRGRGLKQKGQMIEEMPRGKRVVRSNRRRLFYNDRHSVRTLCGEAMLRRGLRGTDSRLRHGYRAQAKGFASDERLPSADLYSAFKVGRRFSPADLMGWFHPSRIRRK